MDSLVKFISYFLWPIAIPAWLFEYIMRKFIPNWQFNAFTATPYLLLLNILSIYFLTLEDTFFRITALFIITSMEFLSLWVCVSISIGKYSQILALLKKYSKRGEIRDKQNSTFTLVSLYMAVISYGYCIFFFGILNYAFFLISQDSYKGVIYSEPIIQLFDFIYYSAVTITTLGYGDITPIKIIPKLLVIIELFFGLFFMVFIFGAYVSFYINKISNKKTIN